MPYPLAIEIASGSEPEMQMSGADGREPNAAYAREPAIT